MVVLFPKDFNYSVLAFRSSAIPQYQPVQSGLGSPLTRTWSNESSSAVGHPSTTRLKSDKPSETKSQSVEREEVARPKSTVQSANHVETKSQSVAHEDVAQPKSLVQSDKRSETKSQSADHQPSPVRLTIPADYPIAREKALLLPACTNVNHPPDKNHSKLYRLSAEKIQLGSQIRVSVRLYNGYNKPVTTGGHALRARIFNDELKAGAPGRVQDHQNGTYTVTLDALWVGKAIVQVNIAYTREAIRALYYWRKKSLSTREQYAVYKSDKIEEKTSCHVFPEKLNQNRGLCNLTYENSGSPWYCEEPSKSKLLCEDFTLIGTRAPKAAPISKIEETVLERSGETINQKVSFDITEGSVRGQKVAEAPSIPCSRYNTTTLWTRTETTGVLYNGSWRLMHCKVPTPSTVQACLKNRRLLIFGDSTTRHWFVNVRTRFDCQMVTEGWDENVKWHHRAECVVKSNNLAVSWIPHCQPFQTKKDKPSYTMKSVGRHLADLGDNENAIILVHVFLHTIAFDDDVFRVRIRHTRQSVETFLKRNKVAKVFIKGPHTYHQTSPGRNDFFGYPYKRIIVEEFYGLYDRVIYLDNNDATVAQNNYWCHPLFETVSAMVDQMFAYVC